MRQSLTARVLLLSAVILSASGAAVVAFSAFPLVITFAPLAVPPEGVPLEGVTGGAPYVDRAEGRVPVVIMNRDGAIQMDTRGSTRTLCFQFGGAITVDLPAVAPQSGCYPVLLRTLLRPSPPQIVDLVDGETLDYGLDLYWTGTGQDGRIYDYVVEYKRFEGNGVDVTYSAGSAPSENTWTVSGDRPGRISVYRRGVKPQGWSVVGTYRLPIHFTAVRGS